MEQLFTSFEAQQPWAQTVIAIGLIILAAVIVNFFIKRVILRAIAPILDTRSQTADKAAFRLATAVPLLVISGGIGFVPHLPEELVSVVANIARACIALSVATAISKALDYVNEVYERYPESKTRPIKGYIQVLKIITYCAAAIIVISILIQQSPLLLLSGLGAMAAVLMLVFKDTILSLVASIQLTSNDMLRVGDWIEMPSMNADGDVVDIALHTVKVQNWDKTISFVPTHSLISQSYKNWRGMSESGGRRIKRSLLLNQNSVRFLSEEEVSDLKRFKLLEPYLDGKVEELGEWNDKEAGGSDAVNQRRITNLGTLRAYIYAYLKQHKNISKGMTLLVRQLSPTAQGLPIELYCFTNTTAWGEYEAIQSDIFDHLISILPEFDLCVFQEPSGMDVREAPAALGGSL